MPPHRIADAIAALRRAGHTVEPVEGEADLYRVDGKDPIAGPLVYAVAARFCVLDPPKDEGPNQG